MEKICKKKVIQETKIFLKVTLFSLLIFSICYTLFTDFFDSNGVLFILQIISVPIVGFMRILKEGFWPLLFLPYLFYFGIKYFLKKKDKNFSLLLPGTIFLFLFHIFVIQRFFSCHLNYQDSFYKTEYQVCFGQQTGVVEGGGYTSKRVKGSDYQTFTILNDPRKFGVYLYAKDKEHVYYGVYKGCIIDCSWGYEDIVNADPNSFQLLEYGWSKDNHHIYYNGTEVLGADAKTLEVLDKFYAQDKEHLYKGGEISESEKSKVHID